jgi:protease I
MKGTSFLVVAASILLLASFRAPAESNPGKAAPRIAMIVAPRDFTDAEFFEPMTVFVNAGAKVTVASTSRQAAESHAGRKIAVNQAIAEIKLDQFDALVLSGGMGAVKYLLDDEALRSLLRASVKAGKVIAAICIAPAVLARAGVLRNVEATCYSDKAVIDILKINGALYTNRKVVMSGQVVTGNGPEASKEFALAVLDTLKG